MLKLHHLSLAVNDVEKALKTFQDMLGLDVAGQGIKEFPARLVIGQSAEMLNDADRTINQLFVRGIHLHHPIADHAPQFSRRARG